MKHLVNVTKNPAAASYGIFGRDQFTLSKLIPFTPADFEERGDLVGKWSGIVTGIVNQIV